MFYKYLKTKILSFFFVEIRIGLLITCKQDVKVHRASWLNW